MLHSPTAVRAVAVIARLTLIALITCFVDFLVHGTGPGTVSSIAGAAETTQAAPDEPLHQRIDKAVEQAAIGPLAPRCNDADFVRRIYLDLTGVIPTTQQTKSFLDDDSPDKRARLIDSLLDSPGFTRHVAMQLDVLLLDRRSDNYVEQKAWERYLIESIARNKPLDQIFRELVYPDSLDEGVSPARKFLLNRDAEPHAMTRDVGRMLFGMDLQCAQCHDHPLIDDYFQADYYGLYAFLNRTGLFTDPSSKVAKLSERAEGETAFESVFTGDGRAVTRPRLPKGASLYVEPTFSEEEAYLVKPEKTQAAKPAYSRREALANMLADSGQFRRNLANRLWTMIIGQGLVHPGDFHYLENPPTNPRLLTLLAKDIADNEFDLRYVIRELTLSKTYQRSCEPAPPETLNLTDIRSRLELVTQQRESLLAEVDRLRTESSSTRKDWKSAIEANDQVAGELPALEAQLAESRQAVEQAEADQAEAMQTHQRLVARMESFETVLAATRTAKEQLDDEPALAESIAILEKRSAELTASFDAAVSELEQKAAALEVAHQAVRKLETEVASLEARRVEPDELVRLEQIYLAAESHFADADAARHLSDAQTELSQSILSYPTLASDNPAKAEAVWKSIVDRWTVQGQVAALKPLTPEQLAISTMRATGFLERIRAAAKAAIEKEPPQEVQAEGMPESEKAQAMEVAVQVEMLKQLRGSVGQFVTQFGGLAGEEFQATVNQALFLGNSPTVSGWLTAAPNTLVGRLTDVEEPQQVADELTVAVFSRSATRDEQRAIADFLAATTGEDVNDRSAALAELVWALITSNEFRFNH